MRTISMTAEIGPERCLEVKLPDDVPLGMADVVVVDPQREFATRAREELLKVSGVLDPGEADAFEAAHRHCETVHPDDWR